MADLIRRKAIGQAWETEEDTGGSGYTPPTAREVIHGSNVIVADGGDEPLTFDTKISGDNLLDISTPASPLVVVAGIYAVSITVGIDASMTDGGSYYAEVRLDSGGDNAVFLTTAAPATTAQLSPRLCVSGTYYIPTGGGIVVSVENRDGAQALPFFIFSGVVQRIT